MEWWLLLSGAFFAGLVDAVVGGGGLVMIPLLLSVYPEVSIPVLFGTNKLAAIVGTGSACWRYARSVEIPWRLVSWAAVSAFAASWVGAQMISLLPKEAMKPLVLLMLVVVGLYTFLRKDFGKFEAKPLPHKWVLPAALGVGGSIGFYDGFFGPGTGSFLIFAFVRIFGFDFLKASASAKFVNVATNLAALVFFVAHEGVMWKLGIAMAVANLLGAQIGSQLAIRKGNSFIRYAFLVVLVALLTKLAWEILQT